nr:PPE family protein [Mycobacterium shigaense]
MAALMSFGMLPPEVNSARMYTGAGSGPLLTAAASWQALGTELHSAAMSYSWLISELRSTGWRGSASAKMAAAVAPYITWLNVAAAQAESTAAQATAAAGAYHCAFVATVPPKLVAANRAQLIALITTNIFGQNTPAIAANEAQYAQMWAQDTTAMYSYAASAAAATQLTPFTLPPDTVDPAGLAAQSAAVMQADVTVGEQITSHQLTSAIPDTLQELARGIFPESFDDLWEQWGPNAQFWNTAVPAAVATPSSLITTFFGLASGEEAATDAAVASGTAAELGVPELGADLAAPVESATMFGAVNGGPTTAGLSKAVTVGALSVPPSWAGENQIRTPTALPLGATPMINAGAPQGTPGMPGMPMGPPTNRDYGRTIPQYGFRLTVLTRPPAGG